MLSKGFLELARKLVAANTVSSEGTRQAADLLQTLWERAGLAVRRQVVDGVHVNLAGGPGGGAAGAGGVLLVTHLDTVPPGPLDKWQTDPWTLTERDGFLSGLGCADVKLDALCKAEAARRPTSFLRAACSKCPRRAKEVSRNPPQPASCRRERRSRTSGARWPLRPPWRSCGSAACRRGVTRDSILPAPSADSTCSRAARTPSSSSSTPGCCPRTTRIR